MSPRIVTKYDPPPIPLRHFDWCATLEDYDPESNDPRGFGRTEAEAIADLNQQLEEEL